MPFKDLEKRRQYRRIWYSKNKKSEINHVKNRKLSIKKWLNEFKSGLNCTNCKENNPATLDFHHKSDKEFTINYMVSNGYSKERIKKELLKCIVLCSNCHRKLHYKKQ